MENSIVVDDSNEYAARELDMQDASQDMLSTQSLVLTELLPSNPESQLSYTPQESPPRA